LVEGVNWFMVFGQVGAVIDQVRDDFCRKTADPVVPVEYGTAQ
jgi:hypothetical protein